MASVKDAVATTFSNRGTELRLIQIEGSLIETTQKYWNLYLRALSEDIKRDLSVDFKKVINEINQNSIRFGFVPNSFHTGKL